jgi:hypothetical protein
MDFELRPEGGDELAMLKNLAQVVKVGLNG